MNDLYVFNRKIKRISKESKDPTMKHILEYMNHRNIDDFYTAFDSISSLVGLSYQVLTFQEKGRRKESYMVVFNYKPRNLISENVGEKEIQSFNSKTKATEYMAKEVYYRFMRIVNLNEILLS